MIMCLFVGSTLFGIPNNNMRVPLEEELDPIVKEPNFEVPESPQTKTVPSGWQLGESVEVVHSFTTKTAKRVIDTYPNEALASTTITGDLSRTYESDDIYQKIFCNVAVDCDEPYPDYNNFFMGTFLYMLSFEYEIEVKVAGSVWVECESIYITNKGTNTGFDETSYVSVTQEHISSGGNTKLKVCAFAGEEMDIALVYYLFNYEDSDWDSTVADTSDDSTVGCAFTSLELKVDRIYFTPTNITEKIRSEYSYFSESVIIHKLEIFNVDYGTSITIKKPSYWSYSSVNFDCSVSDSTDTILTNTLPTIYEILYISNNSYFLAIEEKTDSYLTDIGFENAQWSNDFDTYTSSHLTPTISTSVVFEGYHSLKLVKISGSEVLIKHTETDVFSEGDYYFSFSYYVDSWTDATSDFKLYWGSSSDNEIIASQSTVEMDRWYIYQTFISITEDDYAFQFYIDASSSTATIYIDNIQIFKTSTFIETTDLDTYQISSTFRVWDGYLNPTLSNENVVFEMWSRTDIGLILKANGEDSDNSVEDTYLATWETTTNSDGLATWIYSGSLEQKEYSVYAYTFRNFFGNYFGEVAEDLCDFVEDTEGWEVLGGWGDSFTISDGLGKLDGTASTSVAGMINNFATGVIDSTYNHLIYTSYSDAVNYNDNKIYGFYDGSSNYIYYNGDCGNIQTTETESLSLKHWNFDEFMRNTYAWDRLSDWILTAIILHNVEISEDTFFDNIVYADNSYLSTFHFTPSLPYNLDYAEEVLSNEWDFSEGAYEDWTVKTSIGSPTIENGYMWRECSGNWQGYWIDSLTTIGQTIDFENYNLFQFRVWTNVTDLQLELYTRDVGNNLIGLEIFASATQNDWTYYEFDISIWANYLNIDEMGLETHSSTSTYPLEMKIDWIRLVQVEELSYFTTDTTITLDSENSALVNKVYSDGQCLGDYIEPGIVALNCTLSVNHNITRVPFARANINKAFLYSETTQYTYLISIASNYFTSLRVSIDAAGGLLYVGYLTYWGNTTIRVADNGTWLGSAQNEGNTIWSFDETNYGLHNFTLYFYNGGDTWVSFSTSVTIVEPDLTVLALSYYEKHYDADAGHIYLNYDTTWGNTTIRVSDNSSWLGAAVSGEGLSIWTTNSDYGLHNITIIIYNDGVEWFTDIFTFTYNQPSQIWREVLFRFTSSVTGATIDSEKYLRIFIDDQLVSAGTVTYLENFNITIYDRFNNELYTSTNTLYAAIIDVALPLRLVNFTNPNAVACRYELWKGSYARELIIASLATESYYLFDSNYTLIAEALDPHYLDNIQYILTDSTFTVEVGMATITITLNTYEQTDFLMSFTFTSSYTGGTIDAENYLMIFLNGTKIDSSVNVWSKDNFELLITDNFDNILYDSTIGYSRVVAITLAMRQFTFTNMEQEATTIDIQQSGSDGVLFFPLAIAGTIPVWLTDGSYTVTHSPRDPDKETNVLWTSKSYNFDCSISSQTLSMYLDQFEIVDAPTDFMSSIREYFQENMNMMIVVLVTLVIVAIIVIVSTVVIVQKVSELILLMKKKKNQTEE